MDPFSAVRPASSSSSAASVSAANTPGANRLHTPHAHAHNNNSYHANTHVERNVVYPDKKLNSSSSSSHSPSRSPQSPRHTTPNSSTASSSAASSVETTKKSTKSSSATSAAIAATYQKKSEIVYLNVYDLSPYNQYLHSVGFGAYHSAVEIFGREYSFGFHNSDETGVFSMLPKQVPNAVFRETIEVGNIYLTYNQFNLILNQLKVEWTGNKYHLLKRNCNHFSKALLAALGLKAPSFVNRLASAGDTLASVIPSFMLPKQVNALIKDGRPDMSPPPGEEQNSVLASVPSGRSRSGSHANGRGAGIPNLSGRPDSWRQISPQPTNFLPGDEMDDESFSAFLKQSELEYERSQQYKKLQAQTRQAADEQEAVHQFQQRMRLAAKEEAAAASVASTSKQHHYARSPIKEKQFADIEGRPSRPSPQAPHHPYVMPPDPDEIESQVENAMSNFQLPENVSEQERAQIRAVLRMSIAAGAR